jgi:hypothetical protein
VLKFIDESSSTSALYTSVNNVGSLKRLAIFNLSASAFALTVFNLSK